MIFNVAIVEDSPEEMQRLTTFFERYESENPGTEFKISTFSDGDEICENFQCRYDVILMDIQMKRLDGMKAAEYLRKFDDSVEIIFVTNCTQYAISGYKVRAFNYILKPMTYAVFSAEVKRFTGSIAKKREEYILISMRNNSVRLALVDIIYVESVKHKIIFHTKDAEYEIFGTMRDYESRLEKNNFFRCNSGYLINLMMVNGVKDDMVNVGGYELKISRPRKKQFMERLAGFYCEG